MKIETLSPSHYFSSNTYLISSGGEYAVIDPSTRHHESLVPGRLKYILLTHSHFDHILDIDEWAEGGAEVVIFESEADFLSDPERNCYRLFNGSAKGYFGKVRTAHDGQVFSLGDEEFTLMHLPGHTIGSSAYVFDGVAFVGDTVFAGGGFGRCDLPSGNAYMLVNSIERLLSLPDETILYCGHGDPTTVKQYKIDTKR